MALPYYVEDGGGFVYLVQDTGSGLHKIGCTIRLFDRLRSIATGSCNEILFVWYVATNDPNRLEKAWHKHWDVCRVTGEWFRLSPEQVQSFKACRAVNYQAAADLGVKVPTGDPFNFSTRSVWRKLPMPRVGELIAKTRKQMPHTLRD